MSAATTAATGGEEYWLLKSTDTRTVSFAPPASAAAASAAQSPPQGVLVCPIELEACSRAAFHNSVRFQRKFVELRAHEFMSERIHGRRCGDEVELFGFGRDGEETPGLRAELEALGLTIRTFSSGASSSSASSSSSSTTTEDLPSPVVRPSASPPPSRTRDPAVSAPVVPVPDDPVEKAYLRACSAKIHAQVVAHELATHEPTPYAVIADANTPGGKRVLGVIVDRNEFQAVRAAHEEGEHEEIEANGVLYPILGLYAKGSTVWWREGKELKGIFGAEVDRDVEVVWFSRVKEEADRARREKRREKKERRREMVATTASASATASTSAAAAEQERDPEGGETNENPVDEEAQHRAQTKKDKEKARKRAYQARRRQNKKQAKVQEFGTAAASSSTAPAGSQADSDDDQEDSDDKKTNKKTTLHGADLRAVLQVLTQRERTACLAGSRQQLTPTTTATRLIPLNTLTRIARPLTQDDPEATEPDTSSSSSSSDDDGNEEAKEGKEDLGGNAQRQSRPNIVRVSSIEEGAEVARQAAAQGRRVYMGFDGGD